VKTYNQSNFFKHTFCEFQEIDRFEFPEDTNYKSKSKSMYFYTDEGVYRKSNHWGRVANCRWKLVTDSKYKNQKIAIGFAKWTEFQPINAAEKIFYIDVDFDTKKAILQAKNKDTANHLFTFSEAQKRIQQINHLFRDDKWSKYFQTDLYQLSFKIISTFISSNLSLREIKRSHK
jgi:hypothetical protein|tara:strand:- start:5992 stop:6516 length:525 start_codon:yes stop_codon:yes gene_type:complete